MSAMDRKTITSILTAVNSAPNLDKYPWGNAELAQLLKAAEAMGYIKWNAFTLKWEKK